MDATFRIRQALHRPRSSNPNRGTPCGTAAAVMLALFLVISSDHALAFGFEQVAALAKERASSGFRGKADLPKELHGLSQDQYRQIRNRPARHYWASSRLPFELAFFHSGWQFDPVKLNEITSSGVHEIKFSSDYFDYGKSGVEPEKLKSGSFAGFRVLYPINAPKQRDEVLSFLGASYFRGLGHGQRYGASARGLAIDTAEASGEEFPRFVEFWIERPGGSARELVIYGLLDSPRMSGAYRFVLKPGVDTAVEVKSRLFMRDKPTKVGFAPLTSMYYFGENQRGASEDYRPEVHDSDGLSVRLSTGEWIWRPLVNPKRLLVTSFAATNPAGFGLMQRDRDFSHYEDLGARPDLRPSVWVEPRGAWGAGRIELVQIPAPDETNDNIVAYWVPDQLPGARKPIDLEYRLLWEKDLETRPPHSWVAQTRRGRSFQRSPDGSIGLLVDFEGPALREISSETQPEGEFTVEGNAKLLERTTLRNEATGGWRTLLRIRRVDDTKPVELRGGLRAGDSVLSETWSYILPPG